MVADCPGRSPRLRTYIAKDSPCYARRFIAKLETSVETLTDHPHIWRRVPEAERDDVRELIFRGYRIIYLTRPDHLHVVTVIHGSQDLVGRQPQPWEVV